jgi:hypothetical protein
MLFANKKNIRIDKDLISKLCHEIIIDIIIIEFNFVNNSLYGFLFLNIILNLNKIKNIIIRRINLFFIIIYNPFSILIISF